MSDLSGGMSILRAFEDGKEVGANLTRAERAALSALIEWREAGRQMVADMERLQCIPEDVERRYEAALAALQEAADAPTKGREG